MTSLNEKLSALSGQLTGELYTDDRMRILYATDASAYREMPLAVAVPKSTDDLKLLIDFARKNQTSLIPRTAGTSLAGQVVGHGIIVDVSKNFDKILELNTGEKWVRVEPAEYVPETSWFVFRTRNVHSQPRDDRWHGRK